MSKFLIVSGSYDPYPTANGVCAKAVEEELKNRGHEVVYMVTRHNLTQKTLEVINGNNVYFIPKVIHEVHWAFEKMHEAFSNNRLESLIIKCTHFVIKLLFKVVSFFRGGNSRSTAINIYKENFMNIMKELFFIEKPDFILSFSVPYSSHIYTQEVLKNIEKNMLWASFMVDAHQYKKGISDKQKESFSKQEKLVFENADLCFFLDVLKENYNVKNHIKYVEKFKYFKLPFFKLPLNYKEKNNIGIVTKADVIDITFAGTLYDDSSPIDFFNSFIKECKGSNVKFHLMGKFYPKTMKVIRELIKFMPSQIEYYGFVSRDFVLASLFKSNILINIGNNNTNQIPSKILEYIGMQKIFFSFIRSDNDASINYLEKYPFAYIVNEKTDLSMLQVVKHAMAFYEEKKNEKKSIKELRDNFKGYLQEDVTKLIVDNLESKLYE